MSIYPANLHGSVGDIVERFHEEQSELLKEIRRADKHRAGDGSISDSESKDKVLEEMSDLLSWYLALGAKLAIGAAKDGAIMARSATNGHVVPDFDLMIFREYREGCHTCGHTPCDCGGDAHANRTDLKPAAEDLKPAAEEGLVVAKGEATAWLLKRKDINLREYAVVGKFVVGNDERRARLATAVDEIKKGYNNAVGRPYPVLLCGASGTGKTRFAKEVAESMKLPMRVKKTLEGCDDIAEELELMYLAVIDAGPDTTALLDEFDTVVETAGKKETAYRHLLSPIADGKVAVKKQALNLPHILWFFAGSAAESKEGFGAHLEREKHAKGRDCLRRFGEKGMVVEFSMPESAEDIAVLAAAMAADLLPDLRFIERMALFYVAVHEWPDLGELKGAVERACAECVGETLRFDHFHATAFAVANAAEYERLGDKCIHIIR